MPQSATAPPHAMTRRTAGQDPLTVAHRGYSAVAPENTLAAVEAGVRAGAEYVEIDARTTADGVPVLMHDSTVDRTTNGSGVVAELDAAYVTGLDAGSWFSPAFAAQRVPTLAQALDVLAESGSGVLLEVKGPQPRAGSRAIVSAVLEHDLADRVLVQSFDERVLRDARELAPELPIGVLRSTMDADPVAAARAFGAVAYNPSAATLRPGAVGELTAAGVSVMPYTVDEPEHWQALADLGVDAIITNRAGEHADWRADRLTRASGVAASPSGAGAR
ncbi:glycerophosphodiester phosphodiesterase [Prauserella oleivorans]|uniref:Glycerophosphodiester phosphodiesterase n=1 Tax=Prauserella oleivorans TaxID=1478153 RepID=A0ABW5WJ57_9PSEU